MGTFLSLHNFLKPPLIYSAFIWAPLIVLGARRGIFIVLVDISKKTKKTQNLKSGLKK
jgi:hypothetical protein